MDRGIRVAAEEVTHPLIILLAATSGFSSHIPASFSFMVCGRGHAARFGKPAEQSHTVFKDLSGRLDAQLAERDGVAKTDIPVFNKDIAKKKIEPVK